MIIHKQGGKIKRGHGIFDFIKPLFNVVESIASNPATPGIIKSSVEIGKNTKNIIDAIRKKPSAPPVQDIINEVSNVQDVIERIKKLKAGTGCRHSNSASSLPCRSNSASSATSQLCRCGKGFRYI